MEADALVGQTAPTLSAPLNDAPAEPASPTGRVPDETDGAGDAGADGVDDAAGEGEGEQPQSDDDGDGGAGSNNDDSEEDKYIAPILDGREVRDAEGTTQCRPAASWPLLFDGRPTERDHDRSRSSCRR